MLISLFFVTLIIFMLIGGLIGAPMVMSKKANVVKMIELLEIQPGQTLYDLGSGDGRLLIMAAQKGARGVGIDINPYILLWSMIKTLFSGNITKIKYIWGNYWNINLSNADLISVFAMPHFMTKLSIKLREECKKGTKVVSNCFIIPHLTLIRHEIVGNNHIYLYKI